MLSIAPPVIFQELLGASVNIIDTIMVGRAMGVAQVAAVGLANQILFLFFLMIFGLISGASIFIGQYFGKNDINSIHKVMGIGLVFNLLVAVIFFLPSFFVPHLLIGIYSRDPVVIALGSEFLRIVSFSFFFIAIVFTRNAAMRSMRQTRIPMIITSIALILNAIFNYLAIFVFDLGLTGVAAGTTAARFIELVIQEFVIRFYKLPIKANFKEYLSFDLSFLRRFFGVSIFVIFNEMGWALGTSAYNVAYGLVGTEAQGAVQISMAMTHLFQVFGSSIAISTGIIISNTLGASQNELATRYARKCIIFGIGISMFMGALLVIFTNPIVAFYQVEPHVERYISNILIVAAVVMFVRTTNFTTIVGILRSGGDTKFGMYTDIGGVYLVGLPLAFLGAYLGLPIYLVFLMASGEEAAKFFFGVKRVYSNKWANTIV